MLQLKTIKYLSKFETILMHHLTLSGQESLTLFENQVSLILKDSFCIV